MWDGDSYVETGEHTVPNRRVFGKEVWSDGTANSFTQILYVGEARDKL
jgi:hypothetical protein